MTDPPPFERAFIYARQENQIGGAQNWAQTLFAGGASYLARAANAPQIAAAGFTAAYKDCGVNPTTC